jgi:hypothetical protein
LREAFAERGTYVLFGRKIEVKRPFGNVRGGCDLLDRGRPDPVLKNQTLGGVHQLVTPLFRRLGPWARLGCGTDAPTNTQFTALTRPRMAFGVEICTKVWRMTMLTMSKPPAAIKAASDSQKLVDRANTTVAIPKPATQASMSETHGIVGRGVDIPADSNVQHLRSQFVGGADGFDRKIVRLLPIKSEGALGRDLQLRGCQPSRLAKKKAARSGPSLTRVLSLRAAESAITRMDARRKLLLFRDPPEKVRELRPLRLVKGGA